MLRILSNTIQCLPGSSISGSCKVLIITWYCRLPWEHLSTTSSLASSWAKSRSPCRHLSDSCSRYVYARLPQQALLHTNVIQAFYTIELTMLVSGLYWLRWGLDDLLGALPAITLEQHYHFLPSLSLCSAPACNMAEPADSASRLGCPTACLLKHAPCGCREALTCHP